MAILKDNQVEITDENGNKYLMEIYFTFEGDENGQSYAFIYDKSSPDELYLMKYNEDGSMEEVTNEDEINMAEEVLDAYNNDPKIQDIK